jgi:zinc transport system ATP-binding protein
MDAKITIENLSVTLGNHTIIEDVSAEIPAGKMTAVIGPNGAGKTTLLQCILGLVPFKGKIRIGGRDITQQEHPSIGYVPQKMEFDRGLPLKVMEFLSLGGQKRPVIFGIGRARRDQFEHYLSMVNSSELTEKKMSDLSGGEMQRVLLAKSLCGNPDILFLDEPVSGIDVAGEKLFCDILDDIQKSTGKTVVLVSHDLSVVTSHADYVLCLNKRIKCSGTPIEVMTTDNLLDLFGPHSGLYIHGESHEVMCTHDDTGSRIEQDGGGTNK